MFVDKSFRLSISVLVLLVSMVVGCSGRYAGSEVNYRRIKVGPSQATVNPDSQHLSKSLAEEAYWIAIDVNGNVDSHRNLYIDFDDPDVFPESKPVTVNGAKRYRVFCTGGYCQSGPIGPNAVVGKTYDYWQTLVTPPGTENSADGHIIIDK